MALDSKSKRFAAAGVARPYMRSVFPVATPSREWRSNIALTTPVNNFQNPPGGSGAKHPLYPRNPLRGSVS